MEQNGVKLKSYYWNEKDQVNCNGLPLPRADAKKTYKKSDWTLYFLTRTNFLKETLEGIKDNFEKVIPEKSLEAPETVAEPDDSEIKEHEVVFVPEKPESKKKINGEEDEIRLEDVPF